MRVKSAVNWFLRNLPIISCILLAAYSSNSGCSSAEVRQNTETIALSAATVAADQAAANAVNNAMNDGVTYQRYCPYCGALETWQGRYPVVHCGNCGRDFTVNY